MPGRPLRMSRSDSRYGTPHGVSSCQRTCGGVPAHIPPRKKSSPPTPSPIAFDAATSSPLDPNRSEPQATTGAGRRGRRRGRRRRGPRSRKDRKDKQEATQERTTETSEQTYCSRSCSPPSSPCESPPPSFVRRPDVPAVPSIQDPGVVDPSTGTQQWLSIQQDYAHPLTEQPRDVSIQQLDVHGLEASKSPPSPSPKPAPRRPRPAFLGCHLPIPATEVAETKPFPLSAPQYTAKELSIPRQYNADYPHPLTVYASPAVNPASVAASGYAPLLSALQERPQEMMGHILAECGRPDITALGLTLDKDSKEGCGIPEKFWLRLSSWDGVKVPLGAIVPFARSTRASAPRLGGSRPESSLSQSATAIAETLPLLRARARTDTDFIEFSAIARHPRRASVDAGHKPLNLSHINPERRGSLPNLDKLHSTREGSLQVPPRQAYAQVRRPSQPHPTLTPPRVAQPMHAHESRLAPNPPLLSTVPETDSVDPIGAERKLLRKTRPPALGLSSMFLAPPAEDDHIQGGILDCVPRSSTMPVDGNHAQEILTPPSTTHGLTTPCTPGMSLPLTPRTPLNSYSSMGTTFEFSTGKSIWS